MTSRKHCMHNVDADMKVCQVDQLKQSCPPIDPKRGGVDACVQRFITFI